MLTAGAALQVTAVPQPVKPEAPPPAMAPLPFGSAPVGVEPTPEAALPQAFGEPPPGGFYTDESPSGSGEHGEQELN